MNNIQKKWLGLEISGNIIYIKILLFSLFLLKKYMGVFANFGLNLLKRGQTNFNQLQIPLNPEELKSLRAEFSLCSLITAMCGLAEVMFRGCDHWKNSPKKIMYTSLDHTVRQSRTKRSQEFRPAFTVSLSLNLSWVPWDLSPAEPLSASGESLGFLT